MSVLKSSLWFSAGTLISRIFGLLRESVIAGVFGASLIMDAFLVANRIPNMLREMLAEGALGSSFTKVYSSVWESDKNRARRLLADALYLFTILGILISIMGVCTAPYLVDIMTTLPKDSTGSSYFLKQTTGLTRLLFPFIGLMMLASIASGALHQKGKFFLSSLAPIALNVGYLVGALIFARLLGDYAPDWVEINLAEKTITGLALGVLLGGTMQVLLLLLALWKPFIKGQLKYFKPRAPWSPEIKKIFILMGPMIVASSAGQINVLVNTNFATQLGTGAVTWLTFSFRLLQLPIGIFAVAIGSVALPAFTRALTLKKESKKECSKKLSQFIELITWSMIPCFAYLFHNSIYLIKLLFEHGKFTHQDSLACSDALFLYSFGLLAYGLIKVLTALYYALDRTNFAMKISLLSIFINFFLNYILVDDYGHKGLAMTASAVLTFNAIGLSIGLWKESLKLPVQKILRMILFTATAFIAAILFQKFTETQFIKINFMNNLDLKLKMVTILITNGIFVCSIFLVFGLLYLKLSPIAAFKLYRNK